MQRCVLIKKVVTTCKPIFTREQGDKSEVETHSMKEVMEEELPSQHYVNSVADSPQKVTESSPLIKLPTISAAVKSTYFGYEARNNFFDYYRQLSKQRTSFAVGGQDAVFGLSQLLQSSDIDEHGNNWVQGRRENVSSIVSKKLEPIPSSKSLKPSILANNSDRVTTENGRGGGSRGTERPWSGGSGLDEGEGRVDNEYAISGKVSRIVEFVVRKSAQIMCLFAMYWVKLIAFLTVQFYNM